MDAVEHGGSTMGWCGGARSSGGVKVQRERTFFERGWLCCNGSRWGRCDVALLHDAENEEEGGYDGGAAVCILV